MPIYEYSCSACKNVFEQLIIRKSDEREVRCPACSGLEVSRVMSRPSASRTGGASPGGRCGPIG